MRTTLEKLRSLRAKRELSSRLQTCPPSAVPPQRTTYKAECVPYRVPSSQEAARHSRIDRSFEGLVNEGWEPLAWANRLKQLADLCQALNPALAQQHRERATAILAILGVEE